MKKGLFVICLILIMSVVLSGCGAGFENASENEHGEDRGTSASFRILPLDPEIDHEGAEDFRAMRAWALDEEIHAIYRIRISGEYTYYYVSMDDEGKVLEKHKLYTDKFEEQGTYKYEVSGFTVLEAGRVGFIEVVGKRKINKEEHAKTEYVQTEHTLVIYDTIHQEISRIPVFQNYGFDRSLSIVPWEKDHIYIASFGNWIHVDLTNDTVKIMATQDIGQYPGYIGAHNGYPLIKNLPNDYTRPSYITLDPDTGRIVETLTPPQEEYLYEYIFNAANSGFDLVMQKTSVLGPWYNIGPISGYSYETGEETVIINWEDYEENTDNVKNGVNVYGFLDPDRFVAGYSDPDGKSCLSLFVRED